MTPPPPGRQPVGLLRRFTRTTLVIPLIVFLALALPKLGQGTFSVDTGWYSAIALQAWRAAAAGAPSALLDLAGPTTPEAVNPYFNKPPLAFILNGLWLWLLGPTVLASRLGSVIAGATCIAATVALARAVNLRPRTQLAAGLVLALTLEFTRHARAFSLDLWTTAFCTLALAALAAGLRTRSGLQLAMASLALSAALLTKPLVPLLVIATTAAWIFWSPPPCPHHPTSPTRRRITALARLAAVALAALILPMIWHAFMLHRNGPEFLDQHYGREIVDRAIPNPVSARLPTADLNRGAVSPVYYTVLLLRAYWPWLPLATAALMWSFTASNTRASTALRLAASAAFVWFIALSLFPDKRPRYMLPLYPALALAVAVLVTQLLPGGVLRAWLTFARWAAAVALAAGLLITLLPVRVHRAERPDDPWPRLFAFLREHPDQPWYAGGFIGHRSARLYLELGRWAVPTHDDDGDRTVVPSLGALILYHRRDGLAPGKNEHVVFTAGDLSVTRLHSGFWSPSPAPDHGE